MKRLSIGLILFALLIGIGCRKKNKKNVVPETRTSGTTTLLVDESFARILDDQVMVFKGDYHDATVKVITGNENEILPTFTSGKIPVIVLSRMLKPGEESYYRRKQIPIYTDRFAIDGIALITNVNNIDSNISVNEVLDILKGTSQTGKKLVFDNAKSSTIRYFADSAKITALPKQGVYTLRSNNEVIRYIAEHPDYIGVVGVNWLMESNKDILSYLPRIKTMGVKNLPGKKGSDAYYKPTQNHLINGVYPFLRNVYLINAEGRDGLGTGFANWLNSPRGQLIVLKSGLGPHKMLAREFNIKKTK